MRSINLDSWMMDQQQLVECFMRHALRSDVCVVDGSMGLFDGFDGRSEDGSTAQIAKWLGAPVVLVIDCWAVSRSAAALVKGYQEFDADLKLAGVFFNQVSSRRTQPVPPSLPSTPWHLDE